MEAPLNASWLPAGGAARLFEIVKPGRRSRARLASRRWRPFLTIKARQNALATNFAAGKFPCVWASPTPCPSAGFSTSCGRTDGLFSSLRRATGRTFGADGGVRCRRPRRGSADGGRSASHRCAHRLAKTERMALRRPLCFSAMSRVCGAHGRVCRTLLRSRERSRRQSRRSPLAPT